MCEKGLIGRCQSITIKQGLLIHTGKRVKLREGRMMVVERERKQPRLM
jgi:hypothetical protein